MELFWIVLLWLLLFILAIAIFVKLLWPFFVLVAVLVGFNKWISKE